MWTQVSVPIVSFPLSLGAAAAPSLGPLAGPGTRSTPTATPQQCPLPPSPRAVSFPAPTAPPSSVPSETEEVSGQQGRLETGQRGRCETPSRPRSRRPPGWCGSGGHARPVLCPGRWPPCPSEEAWAGLQVCRGGVRGEGGDESWDSGCWGYTRGGRVPMATALG